MDIEFLQRIKQKLQIGNTRSIHLNAFPGRLLLRLDAYELNNLKKGLPEEFIQTLLNQSHFSFKFNIKIDDLNLFTKREKNNTDKADDIAKKIGVLSKRFTSMLYENEDNYLEHGIKTFGFGFPMLAYRPRIDPAKTIYAPIIIWKLDITRSKNEWLIYRDDDYGITLNEVLLNYIEQDQNSNGLSRISEELLDDNVIDPSELQSICNNFLSEIGQKAFKFDIPDKLLPLEPKGNIREKFLTLGNPFIAYSGVFGLFRSQKEAVIKDIKELISNSSKFKFDNLITEKYQTTTFTAIETDPTQSKVLTDIGDNSKLIIHGPPGTGKSQSLTAIITNALANNVKCLVVCEKKTALEVIRKNLELKGLGELCGLTEDVNRDRKLIINSVRERNTNADSWEYKILEDSIKEAERKIKNINSGHQSYSKKILNGSNWTDLVGRFLKLRKKTDNTELLFDNLKSTGYIFNSEEISSIYNKARGNLVEIYGLYKEIKDSLNDFQNINDNFVKSGQQLELSMKLKTYLQRLDELILKLINFINNILNDYEKKLIDHFNKYKSATTAVINEIFELNKKYSENKRGLFISDNSIKRTYVGLLSLFSSKHKEIKNDRKRMYELNLNLEEHSRLNYFRFQFIDTKHPETIFHSAKEFKNKLDEWSIGIPVILNNSRLNLSLTDFNPNIDYSPDDVKKIYDGFFLLLKSINDSFILNLKLDENIKTVYDILNSITRLRQIINIPLSKISEFSDYHSYKSSYLNVDNDLKEIVNSLIKVKSVDWVIDFDAWFIFNLLINYDNQITLRNDAQIMALLESYKVISQYQVRDILNYWRSKQTNSSQNYQIRHGYNKSTLYNLAKNKLFQKQNSLRKIINSDFELFTNYFPVLLINPTVCSSLFQMKEGMFDVVIFDEASQLRIEDVYAAKLRGKYRIVAGDENQMPPSNYFAATFAQIDNQYDENFDEDGELTGVSSSIADSESLLEYAKRKGFKETYLEIHYRSKHPDLIEFSNAAFYGSRLKPMPPKKDYTAIKYYPVNSIYDQEAGINRDEAEKVINIIDSEVQLNNGYKVPSIGVATLNLTQRNQILNLINEKCENNPEFAKKIYKLKELKGEELFVKNLENIQGDERDIIIISTTFGPRTDGSFIQNYGPLNQEKGFRLLNVIITRAKFSIHVCTSIPENNIFEYTKLLTAGTNKGRAIFYSYLAYAKAVSDNDIEKKNTILNILRDKSENKYVHPDDAFIESVFEQEVLDMLSDKFNPERIKIQYPLGGFRIDMVILSEDLSTPIIAIECDGANYHSSTEAYAWDMFRQKFLEEYGLKFIRIWSTNWFNNPKKELERLINKIIECEEILLK